MDKNVQDYQVENMLENWQKKPLDDKALLAAQKRVWSKIESGISEHSYKSIQPITMTESNNPDQAENSAVQAQSPKPWFLRPLGLSLISLSLVLILVGATTAVYIRNLQTQLAQRQTSTAQNNTQNPNPSLAKLDLSLDEIRSKAVIKLNSITNGVSLEEIQASSAKTPRLASANVGDMGAGSAESSLVNAPTAEVLVKEKGISDSLVYYTESLSTESNGGYLYTYLTKNSNFDLSKPIKSQSWSSANYSKYILSQDGKIISYNTYSPSFSVEYLGGKYAIKQLFDQKIYLSGISQNASNANTELNFLRSVLTDTTLKDAGKQEIDGKSYKVLETDQSKLGYGAEYEGDIYSIKYYIDQENVSVYKTENYINKILVSSTVQTDYQEIKDPNLDQLFGVVDLGSIEVKTTQTPVYYEVAQNLNSIVSKADIYYPGDLSEDRIKNNLYATDNSIYTESESSKLRNSKDFDPSLDQSYLDTLLNPPLINYSFNNVSVNVFKTKIPDEEFLKVQDESKKSIKIDGRDIQATMKTVTYEYGPSIGGGVESSIKAPEPESFYRLEFNAPNGLFYQFVEYKSYDGASPTFIQSANLNLIKLKADVASRIYDFQQKRQQSYPDLNYETNLEDIPSSLRILPGDLSKSTKMELSGVVKSRRLGSISFCNEFLYSGYDLQGCLIEKLNGFTVNYYEKFPIDMTYSEPSVDQGASMAPVVNDLSFSVLDEDLASIDLEGYIKVIEQNNQQNNPITSTLKPTGENMKELSFNDGYTTTTNYFIASGDKTIMVSSSSLGKDQLISIANSASKDKDISILSNQLKASRSPQPVDIPTLMNR